MSTPRVMESRNTLHTFDGTLFQLPRSCPISCESVYVHCSCTSCCYCKTLLLLKPPTLGHCPVSPAMLRAPCQRLVCSVLGLNSFGSRCSSSSTAQPLLATLSSWPAQQQAAPTKHAAGSRCSINSRAYSSDAAADYTEEVRLHCLHVDDEGVCADCSLRVKTWPAQPDCL